MKSAVFYGGEGICSCRGEMLRRSFEHLSVEFLKYERIIGSVEQRECDVSSAEGIKFVPRPN